MIGSFCCCCCGIMVSSTFVGIGSNVIRVESTSFPEQFLSQTDVDTISNDPVHNYDWKSSTMDISNITDLALRTFNGYVYSRPETSINTIRTNYRPHPTMGEGWFLCDIVAYSAIFEERVRFPNA